MKTIADIIDKVHCAESLAFMRDMPDGCVDLVLTDPPYQLNTKSGIGSKINPWADLCNSAFWFAELFREYCRLLKDSGAIWQFLNWRSLPTIQKAVFDSGRKIESLMVWDKEWIGPGGCRGLRPRYELIALVANMDFAIPDRGIPDIITCLWAGAKQYHPAEKPVKVIRRLVEISTTEGQVVLDPFGGSGSTPVACVDLRRHFIAIEMDPKHCKIAEARIQAERDKYALWER